MKYLPLSLLLVLFACRSPQTSKPASDGQEWTLNGFVKVDSINPILQPSANALFDCPLAGKPVQWEERNILNPAAFVKDGKVYLLYRAQDRDMTSRLGLAISNDGLHFVKQQLPVFFPANDSLQKYEWKGGVEDPRIVQSETGEYILTYTAYDGKTARLCIAVSTDLVQWKKYGPVFRQPVYRDKWSKSGAIVARLVKNQMVAAKINGRYWMYFGDTDIFLASSTDLEHWDVAEDEESGRLISVLNPRPGRFDSRLVEPGPYAWLNNHGILLIYNGSNAANFNDSSLPRFTYSGGQALFDSNSPYKLLARTDTNFIRPDKPYERTGEVNEVCFVEGLVWFGGKWLLYYGTADSRIAVAVRDRF